jgi:RNA-directed DNA polymerase
MRREWVPNYGEASEALWKGNLQEQIGLLLRLLNHSFTLDFVITGSSREVLENKVMPAVDSFLKERGLELSKEKTKITHVDDGFDFLGFNVRKYKGKLLIKPSKKNVKSFLDGIRALIKSKATAKQENLIRLLNPRMRGWGNYFCHAVSKGTFSYVDHCIFSMLVKWINRRYPNKSVDWRRKKYFRPQGARGEIFSTTVKDEEGQRSFLDLFKVAQIPIRRHVKIKGEATPYDSQFKDYFLNREDAKRKTKNKDQKCVPSNLNSRHIHWTTGSSNGLQKGLSRVR